VIRCEFCDRPFARAGLQEQLNLLAVHVRARHRAEAAKKHPNDWYREEETPMTEETPPGPGSKPTRDAGDAATKIKWELAAKGVLVVVLDDRGAHIGASGLSPQLMRELACAAVHASYKAQESTGMSLPIIGS
jgi:hypothetical protein